MPASLSISQCLDLINSTRSMFTPGKLAAVMGYTRYDAMNDLAKYKKTTTGIDYTTNIQLEDATNGGAVGMLFHQDVSNINDTDQKVRSYLKRYTNNCTYDRIQLSVNKGDKIKEYDYLKSKKLAMYRKSADDIQKAKWTVPASASDTLSITGIPGFLTLGTDNTAGFTGTNGNYLDGANFDVGGLSATTYSQWASYYDDHNGALDDTLFDRLGDACRATDFQAPNMPNGMKIEGVTESVPTKVQFYTSNNVIKMVEKMLRNSDDSITYDLGKHNGKAVYKSIPFNYVQLLDTANTTVYGTDPIFAVNYDELFPIVLDGWYFDVDEDRNAWSSTVITQYVNLIYNYHCCNRKACGFLISQQ